MNYMLALSIEITFKLYNRAYQYYSLRKYAYHFVSIGFGLFLVILGIFNKDLGLSALKTCSLKSTSLTSNIRLVSFGVAILVMWVLVWITIKKVGKTYSNVIFNYFLVVLSMSSLVALTNILKFIPIFKSDELKDVPNMLGTLTGVGIGVSRLSNKRLLKQIYWKFKSKPKVFLTNKSFGTSNELDSFLAENVGNIGDLFENLTKKTLMQMLASISLRFEKHDKKYFSVENEVNFDQFEYDERLFTDLANHYNIKQIKDSKN